MKEQAGEKVLLPVLCFEDAFQGNMILGFSWYRMRCLRMYCSYLPVHPRSFCLRFP